VVVGCSGCWIAGHLNQNKRYLKVVLLGLKYVVVVELVLRFVYDMFHCLMIRYYIRNHRKGDIVVDIESLSFHHMILLLVPKENNDHFGMIHQMRINSS
jgi:hypothetical protein